MPVYCLEMHAEWRCRHSGACCRAQWAIPIEGPAFEKVGAHFTDRAARTLFVGGGPLPEGAAAILARKPDGACVFHTGRLCSIHRELGPSALPSACRQFPRMALHDGRGTFVTLSHFCPTAAAMLVADGSSAIVEAPSTLSMDGHLEGLDATMVLPPLLRPGLLTDLEGYSAWEQRSLHTLATSGSDAGEGLAIVAAATEEVGRWMPGAMPLADAVSRAFDEARPALSQACAEDDALRLAVAAAAVPEGLSAPTVPDALVASWRGVQVWWPEFDRAARAFLAAHLFGNWMSYYGNGLNSVVAYLRICLSVLRVEAARQQQINPHLPADRRFLEAIRRADWLLVHLMDVRSLASTLARAPTPNSQLPRPGTNSPGLGSCRVES